MAEGATLIIGASRGLGLELTREFLSRGRRVIATMRAPSGPLQDLVRPFPERARIEHVDVTVPQEIGQLRARLASTQLDILFVNAGINEQNAPDFAAAFMRAMATNALGAILAIRMLCELLRADGAIAAMSSGLGSISNNQEGRWEPYRSSKAALNQSLRSFAAEHADRPWSVTAIAPGWVRTDMGGPKAPLSVETSAKGVADVLEARLGARGVAFLNYRGDTIPW